MCSLSRTSSLNGMFGCLLECGGEVIIFKEIYICYILGWYKFLFKEKASCIGNVESVKNEINFFIGKG